MGRNKENGNYWISYTDLMTGFLIIFIILTLLVQVNSNKKIKKIKSEFSICDSTLNAKNNIIAQNEDSLKKANQKYNSLKKHIETIKISQKDNRLLQEIKKALNHIDKKYFTYNKKYKKFILNIDVKFPSEESSIYSLSLDTRTNLIEAGKHIKDILQNRLPKNTTIKYLIVIEGQASRDGWPGNDQLSYNRALSLNKFWQKFDIDFNRVNNCELIIAGSGEYGVPRKKPDKPPHNQRFLIQIVPKIGN
jgi:flagellar motor protein MotB